MKNQDTKANTEVRETQVTVILLSYLVILIGKLLFKRVLVHAHVISHILFHMKLSPAYRAFTIQFVSTEIPNNVHARKHGHFPDPPVSILDRCPVRTRPGHA